jgi:hypothetical protein
LLLVAVGKSVKLQCTRVEAIMQNENMTECYQQKTTFRP